MADDGGEGKAAEGEGCFDVLSSVTWGPPEQPSFASDLLAHYNLRDIYDSTIASSDWKPPRKVGKAEYFVYSTIPGDGHLRCDPIEDSNKYDLAPCGAIHKSTQDLKLRPFPAAQLKEAFALESGQFELPKVDVGVAIHKKDKKDRDKRLRQRASNQSARSAQQQGTSHRSGKSKSEATTKA